MINDYLIKEFANSLIDIAERIAEKQTDVTGCARDERVKFILAEQLACVVNEKTNILENFNE